MAQLNHQSGGPGRGQQRNASAPQADGSLHGDGDVVHVGGGGPAGQAFHSHDDRVEDERPEEGLGRPPA
eukprot:9317220-Alexandrium_andersonii.AAC.1